jgi:hypothetical protein
MFYLLKREDKITNGANDRERSTRFDTSCNASLLKSNTTSSSNNKYSKSNSFNSQTSSKNFKSEPNYFAKPAPVQNIKQQNDDDDDDDDDELLLMACNMLEKPSSATKPVSRSDTDTAKPVANVSSFKRLPSSNSVSNSYFGNAVPKSVKSGVVNQIDKKPRMMIDVSDDDDEDLNRMFKKESENPVHDVLADLFGKDLDDELSDSLDLATVTSQSFVRSCCIKNVPSVNMF